MDVIVDEARQLRDAGVRELILIAQDTTDYGHDLGIKDGLAFLLEQLTDSVPDLDWIRVMYAYPGYVTDRLIEVMARRRVLRDGIEATFRWAEALPDDEDDFKLHVFQRVASSAAEIDPERAAGWASQHEGRDYAWDLARRVGTRWAKREPEKAMTWLASLPESRGRSVATSEGDLKDLSGKLYAHATTTCMIFPAKS